LNATRYRKRIGDDEQMATVLLLNLGRGLWKVLAQAIGEALTPVVVSAGFDFGVVPGKAN
jgi:hypothetical protein